MRRLLCIALSLAAWLHAPLASADLPPLAVEAKIPLGEVKGRIDHLAYDPVRERLYVAELGNDSVGIVDLKNQRLLNTVTGFDEPQGIAYEPATDSVYVASGGDGSVRIFHAEDFSPAGKIALGSDADNVRVDSTSRRVYVGFGNGALAVIDAVSRKRIADIALKGHPESFQLDSASDRIFVNIPDARTIQVVSREANVSIATWTTATLRANFPLAIDTSEGRLLAVFRSPARLQGYALASGAALSGVATCGDADDVFVDPKRRYVHVICGEGSVDTYVPANKTFTRVAQLAISPGSRTGLYLPQIDRLAVAIRGSAQAAAAIWILKPSPLAAVVLFVCEHGNVKSLMAASYFNQRAQARHLPLVAISRGTAPNSTTVPPAIIEGLRADGFDVATFHPAPITAADVASADRVILINTLLPLEFSGASRAESWTDVPPASVDYGAAREALKAHVDALLDQLSAAGGDARIP